MGLFIFFAGPNLEGSGPAKLAIPRILGAGNERGLFRPDCCREIKVFGKPHSTAIKSKLISNIFLSQGLFIATLTKKMETYPRFHLSDNYAFKRLGRY
jgi:hypothetical protein